MPNKREIMIEATVEFLQKFIDNEYILLFVLSIIPLVEMRGSIILSGGMQINHFLAFLTCASASSMVSLPLLLLFRPIMNALKRTKLFKPLALSLEETIETKAQTVEDGKKRGLNNMYWTLFAFVSIPLPLTGVWTGSCVAAFLGLKYWKAVGFIIAGNFLACAILSLLVLWANEYIDIILVVFLVFIVFGSLLVVWKKLIKKKNKVKK